MKTAGDILSNLFDDKFVKKAYGYSKLFESWTDITSKNGIAAAADHSRVKDLDNGLLIIEMDHPGWKQILQTRQNKLLNDFRRRFPQLDITGISLILGAFKPQEKPGPDMDNLQSQPTQSSSNEVSRGTEGNSVGGSFNVVFRDSKGSPLDVIDDDDFKESLKRLGQTILEREKR